MGHLACLQNLPKAVNLVETKRTGILTVWRQEALFYTMHLALLTSCFKILPYPRINA